MILILTGGTEISRQKLIKDIQEIAPFVIYDQKLYSELRSQIEININLPTNKLVVGCFMRSQRYELFCIARRYNIPFYIMLDSTPCEFDYFEIPKTIYKYESSLIMSYHLKDLKEIFEKINTKKNPKKKNFAHKKKTAPTSNYITDVKSILKRVNENYSDYSYLHHICEEQFMSMISSDAINIEDVEMCYKKILVDEINNKTR
ncbi:hypothetical protein EDEG_04066 [Edhazardia aedis USNM 41457]|uniref:Uncharacterized protein n=1 Tax=Edhazardia aedis (strain USNM 41457) TaxID=1003232 RepID=J9DF19_EDHAE|nr:hypothetical protein EDEG_04066 [Edhazardia aedis USNM 41457]|eukprot:EJW01190.1 hypothetical protein EDEG_04066 [Edhazardia aedis USNM 41457]